jgi:hypothetical protein
MGKTYIVKQGDCLYKIAKKEGFANWRTIYDHEKNADFRELRPDPNLIFPGDKLFIPDREKRTESTDTDARRKFKKHGQKAFLYLVIEDEDGNPLDGSYTIDVAGQTKEEQLVSGEIKMEIPADAENGTLVVRPEGAPADVQWEWRLAIGHLDPLEEVSGVQGRLTNLGFECGPVDNKNGPKTREGVETFQKKAFSDPDEWDGIAGPKTKQKLLEHHKV